MLGLYIHIPFCKQKCKYCDFNSYSGITNMSSSYVEALTTEIMNCTKAENREINTIYIGGGTPTYIETEYIEKIMSVLNSKFNISNDAEITIECNPGTADIEKLKRIRDTGINRLSIGLQTTHDDSLKELGRIHTYSDFLDCYSDARKAGFDNISVDLMFGLPNQTPEKWLSTLEHVTKLSPEHISAYSLKIEPGTPFEKLYESGNLCIPDDDQNRDLYDECVSILSGRGYKRYEISNFSKENYESIHNLIYWKTNDYIGFGAGSHSCLENIRYNNIYDIKEYIESVISKNDQVESLYKNTKNDSMCEFVFLGLRLDEGISKKTFKDRFNVDIYDVFSNQLNKHIKLNTIIDENNFIRINPKYTYISNMIMSDFV